MASAQTGNIFPDPSRINPPEPIDQCACLGWGVILGTDSPDSWGDPCPCGRRFARPRSVDEAQELHSAHMQARLYKAA